LINMDTTPDTPVGEAVYDPFTLEFQENPLPYYRRLLEEAPVYYNAKWDFYAFSRFEDVRAAALDHDTYLSFEGIDLDDTGKQAGAGNLPDIDNPRHDQLRAIVQGHFRPRSIAKLEGDIRHVASGLVDRFIDGDTVDIAQAYSWPLPYEVFFNFIGLPTDGPERAQLVKWSHQLKDRKVDSPELTPTAMKATADFRAFMAELLEERRRNPRQDVLTHIVNSEIDGVPFADEHIDPAAEIVGLTVVLFLAGVETTSGLISTLFNQLARHPDQQQALREDPKKIPGAVEEGLRWSTPLQVAARTTARPVTVQGVDIPAGKRVALIYGAANHDPRQYDNPDVFDALRPPSRHMGFGEGLHGCLGNPLARLEAKVALQVALPRMGPFELAGEPRRYQSSPNASVTQNLPIRFAGT
jgi:cytochrome P450